MNMDAFMPALRAKPQASLVRPRGFRPARRVAEVELLLNGPAGFDAGRGNTTAQKKGKKYEHMVVSALEIANIFDVFLPRPWIRFSEPRSAQPRLCQPDAVGFVGKAELVILEIKLTHTIMAYWQLRELYAPVLAALYPSHQIKVCEITSRFDPATPWPEQIALCGDFRDLRALSAQDFGVLPWRSR